MYDEFNGGLCRRSRSAATCATRIWPDAPPHERALIGDASMDYRHDLPTSSVDLVPTYFKFEAVFSSLGQDLVANESWYSRELNLVLPNEGEDMPSIVPSRILPVRRRTWMPS